jgi:hypothetical protein
MSEKKNKKTEAGSLKSDHDSNQNESVKEHFPEDSHTPKQETSNQQPETKGMEVHKHPHHITHKKKWGEYLLEFLMLFLAVFLGFLAENLREHKIEHVRAEEFSKSLVQDLQNDVKAITGHQRSSEIYIAIADSLLKLSKTKLEGRKAAEFSFYTRFMYWTVSVSLNRATFEQIKNSGSLRYFKNYGLLDKMIKYDALVNEVKAEFSNHQVRGNMLLSLINKILEPEYHHDVSRYVLAALDTMSDETKKNYFAVKTETLENKRETIRKMLNMIVVQQRNLRLNADRILPRAKELSNELKDDLKKEYHLK